MAISRRKLLKGVGGAAAATGLAVGMGVRPIVGSASEEDEETEDHSSGEEGHGGKYQWAFVIDLRRCDGCADCTIACQRDHLLPKSQEWIKVYELHDHEGNTVFMPRPCMQCEHPPCLKVCPVAATFKTDEGVVLIDQERCIGCRACMAACPYNARYFNFWDTPKPADPNQKGTPEFPVPQQRGTVGKCDFCTHFAVQGRLPSCIEACRMGAIYIGDLNMDVMTNRAGETYRLTQYIRDNDAFRYKEEANTAPRVWYVKGHGQDLAGRRWS